MFLPRKSAIGPMALMTGAPQIFGKRKQEKDMIHRIVKARK